MISEQCKYTLGLLARDGKRVCVTDMYSSLTWSDVFMDSIHKIMEPIMESIAQYTKEYRTDLLRDYSELCDIFWDMDKEGGNEETKARGIIYAFGIRECGIDHPDSIQARTQFRDFRQGYKAIYILCAEYRTGSADKYLHLICVEDK